VKQKGFQRKSQPLPGDEPGGKLDAVSPQAELEVAELLAVLSLEEALLRGRWPVGEDTPLVRLAQKLPHPRG
jgi:hypothetical protein